MVSLCVSSCSANPHAFINDVLELSMLRTLRFGSGMNDDVILSLLDRLSMLPDLTELQIPYVAKKNELMLNALAQSVRKLRTLLIHTIDDIAQGDVIRVVCSGDDPNMSLCRLDLTTCVGKTVCQIDKLAVCNHGLSLACTTGRAPGFHRYTRQISALSVQTSAVIHGEDSFFALLPYLCSVEIILDSEIATDHFLALIGMTNTVYRMQRLVLVLWFSERTDGRPLRRILSPSHSPKLRYVSVDISGGVTKAQQSVVHHAFSECTQALSVRFSTKYNNDKRSVFFRSFTSVDVKSKKNVMFLIHLFRNHHSNGYTIVLVQHPFHSNLHTAMMQINHLEKPKNICRKMLACAVSVVVRYDTLL
jgi:hypothetical protein